LLFSLPSAALHKFLRTGDYAGNPTAAVDTAAITDLAEYQ
jgi:hypothetical protein